MLGTPDPAAPPPGEGVPPAPPAPPPPAAIPVLLPGPLLPPSFPCGGLNEGVFPDPPGKVEPTEEPPPPLPDPPGLPFEDPDPPPPPPAVPVNLSVPSTPQTLNTESVPLGPWPGA